MRVLKFARFFSRALGLVLAACIASVAQANAPDPATLKKISALAVPFAPNAGQWDSRAAFAAQTFAGTLFVTKQGELVYSLPGKSLDDAHGSSPFKGEARRGVVFSGSPTQRASETHPHPRPPLEGEGAMRKRTPGWALTETLVDASGKPRSMASSTLKSPAGYRPMQASVSYFIGSDETKHAKSLNTYERVNLGDMYPGINLQLRATGNNIEKIFTVAPSYDPKQISIALRGAERLEIGKLGELIAHTGNGPVTFTAPIAYQENDKGERVAVEVAYALVDVGEDSAARRGTPPSDAKSSPTTTYTFTLGAFDPMRPLVIDPLLRSTYLGAAGGGLATALAVHPASGEVYVAGYTDSPTITFPGVSGGAQGTSGGGNDAFVSRFSADLGTLLRSTYLGATGGGDQAYALAIHPASGEVYVAGITNSTTTTFPGVSGGAQGTSGGGNDAFVSRFSADLGTLLRSSYLGAAGNDQANALAIHPASGEVYVAGRTNSPTTTFPGVSGGAQGTSGGGTYDAFVSRFSADLGSLLRSTYLGAAGLDLATALTIHPASGEVYVAGYTDVTTTTFPGVSGGAQGTSDGGGDAFVSRFSADLGTLLRSSYLGAAGIDGATAMAIHPASGEVVVAGYTQSTTTTFPGVGGGAQGTFGGLTDAFVSRFSADLTLNDTTPNAYAFATQTNVPLASTRTSNPALITGIVGAANIYVDGALGSSYCISSASNCSCNVSVGFVNVPGTITPDNYVCVRHVSAPIANEVVRSKLHIGGAVASFISTTGTTFTSCNLDIDGSGGAPDAVSDGLMLVRAMLGFTGTAVTNGAIIGTPPRNTWPLIRDYLNSNCGTNFAP